MWLANKRESNVKQNFRGNVFRKYFIYGAQDFHLWSCITRGEFSDVDSSEHIEYLKLKNSSRSVWDSKRYRSEPILLHRVQVQLVLLSSLAAPVYGKVCKEPADGCGFTQGSAQFLPT